MIEKTPEKIDKEKHKANEVIVEFKLYCFGYVETFIVEKFICIQKVMQEQEEKSKKKQIAYCIV